MGEPTFWDNPDAAQKITQELNDMKSGIETFKNLSAKFDDAQILLELALEEYMQYLSDNGIPDEQIYYMTHTIPYTLLGIKESKEEK